MNITFNERERERARERERDNADFWQALPARPCRPGFVSISGKQKLCSTGIAGSTAFDRPSISGSELRFDCGVFYLPENNILLCFSLSNFAQHACKSIPSASANMLVRGRKMAGLEALSINLRGK